VPSGVEVQVLSRAQDKKPNCLGFFCTCARRSDVSVTTETASRGREIFIVTTIKIFVTTKTPIREFLFWCAREDLNLHARRHIHLKDACLPFQHSRIYYQHIPKDPPIILKALAIFN